MVFLRAIAEAPEGASWMPAGIVPANVIYSVLIASIPEL